ncbi:hypothetical protein C1X05_00115 [Laceyella sacchari]|uniref:Phage portal protein, putative, A118 family n=1 Tax=Laceyella tengchongensis TaxID=574699 RepID=A0AA46AG68_9BACL|nr:phage portal protein [Laceyella tengchongensis]AUS07416.1 hypothetical protein C1X05_00115 [Laceyella sacchari]SMP25223.1 phage portal protein, putative, A118 family [Laceyella tengchongensis]
MIINDIYNAYTDWGSPLDWQRIYDKMMEHAAWYSGDPLFLREFYAGHPGWYWARANKDHKKAIHVPVPAALAQLSGDLIMGEPPTWCIKEAKQEESNPLLQVEQEKLLDMIEQCDVNARLLEAFEMAAALGGVFLKPIWDKELSEYPILTVTPPENAVPVFRNGLLMSVIFYKRVREITPGQYLWLIEKYDHQGNILSSAHIGTSTQLGQEVPLTQYEETAYIQPQVHTGWKGVACRYLPNRLPNRQFRGLGLGMSDFAGLETLFDALDEVYGSWLRDIRLAKSRIHVPETMMDFDEMGNSAFDVDGEVYVKLQGVTAFDVNSLTATQFNIRCQEHEQTAINLIRQIITIAGYSPSSFGLMGDQAAVTATEISARERKSLMLAAKKKRLAKKAIVDMIHIMRTIANTHLGAAYDLTTTVDLEFSDSIETDMSQLSAVVNQLQQAKALSIETAVRWLNPTWSESQIKEEVERIKQENGMALTDPEVLGLASFSETMPEMQMVSE